MIPEEAEFEAELSDIFERYSDVSVEKNIIFILKREHLWDSRFEIIFPIGAFKDIDVTNDAYQSDYEIWKGNKCVCAGTCYGTVITDFNISEIQDMTLEVMTGYKELIELCCKEKVEFT
jgi:hypothetical protein